MRELRKQLDELLKQSGGNKNVIEMIKKEKAIFPFSTSGLLANLCAKEFSIASRKAFSSITPLTFTTAPSIGVLGKFFPRVSSEIVLASQVHTLPLYPFKRALNSEAGLELLIMIAPSSLRPLVTSTLSIRVSSTTTTKSGS